jgi:hypothetical protein
MAKYDQFMTWLLYLSACVFVWQAANLRRDYAEFHRKMVWNVDDTRQQYINDIQFAYTNGCHTGTSYPPELRKSQTAFNANSPTIWCNERYGEKEQYFIDQLPKLGRSPY